MHRNRTPDKTILALGLAAVLLAAVGATMLLSGGEQAPKYAAPKPSPSPSRSPSREQAAPKKRSHTGLRIDWNWIRKDGRWVRRDRVKPFGAPDNFANSRLSDDAPLDQGTIEISAGGATKKVPVNPGAAREIQRQVDAYGSYLNRATYTSPITIVPADQPLTPVICPVNCSQVMNQIGAGLATDNKTDLHGGFPIPDDYEPSAKGDTDAEAVFYQPDYVSPCNPTWRGRFFEAWRLRRNPHFDPSKAVSPTNAKWMAASTGRVVNVRNSPGHYAEWTSAGCHTADPGAPDSTWQYKTGMGVLASGLFIISDAISREDCSERQINHVVGMLVHDSHPSFRPPATRTDGSTPSYPIEYGMRLRFPKDLEKPVGLTPIASMLFDTAQRYGFVIDDGTHASVGFRMEPTPNHTAAGECTSLLDGKAPSAALAGFPWSKLQVIAPRP